MSSCADLRAGLKNAQQMSCCRFTPLGVPSAEHVPRANEKQFSRRRQLLCRGKRHGEIVNLTNHCPCYDASLHHSSVNGFCVLRIMDYLCNDSIRPHCLVTYRKITNRRYIQLHITTVCCIVGPLLHRFSCATRRQTVINSLVHVFNTITGISHLLDLPLFI